MSAGDGERAGSTRAERLRVGALLLVALSIVYPNVIFGGRSLVASDNYNPLRSTVDETSYGAGFVSGLEWRQRGLLPFAGQYDAGAAWWIWEPGAPFLLASLRRGELPHWNPYIGAGVPGLANMSDTHFFPPWLLVVLSGAGSGGKTFYFLGLVFFAGFCTFLFLRRAGLGAPGAGVGALVFLLSSALNSVIISMGGQAVACIPFVMYVTRLYFDRPGPGRLALLATSYAAAALATSPPMLLLGFSCAALYALMVIVTETTTRRARLGLLVRYAGGALLALGLSAFAYLPAAELIAHSAHVRGLYAHAGELTLPGVTLLQLLTSDLGGGWLYTAPVMRDPSFARLHVIGVAAIALALFAGGGGSARRRALTWFAAATSLAMLAKLVGLPPVQWLWRLPVARHLHFAVYASFLLHLLIAILAGVGAERLWRGELRPRRVGLALLLVCAALVALLPASLSLGLGPPLRPGVLNWISRYVTLWLFIGALGLGAWRLGRPGAPPRARALAAGLIVVVVLAEGVHNLSFPRQRRVDVWSHPPPHVRALAGLGDGRRFVHYAAFTANTNAAFGLFGIDSMHSFNPERLVELYRRHFGGKATQFLREMGALPPDPLLDRAGVGWLVVRAGYDAWTGEARRRGYSERYSDDWATIFRRPSGVRFFVTPDWRVLDRAQMPDEVARASSLQVLLEEAPGFAPRAFEPTAEVRVRAFRNNAVSLEASTPGPALLYCAESHMPGWNATVNGRQARILIANHAFRAVEIPAGRSRVEFRYVPPGWRAGLRVSAASLLLVAALALRGRLRRAC